MIHRHIEMALLLWEELTLRCERHCVLREERLVEVPHDLKQPETTMRGNVSVQGDDEDGEMMVGNSPAAACPQQRQWGCRRGRGFAG